MLKTVSTQITKAGGNEKLFYGIASTEHLDRDREVMRIEEGAIDLTGFLKNPVMLFVHNMRQEPVGLVKEIEIIRQPDGTNALAIKFEIQDSTPLGQKVKTLIEKGYLKALSIGGIPHNIAVINDMADVEDLYKSYPDFAKRINARDLFKERGAFTAILEWELLEISIVPVPANANALIEFSKCFGGFCALGKGLDWIEAKDIVIKQAIPYSVHGKIGCVIEGQWNKRVALAHLRAWAKREDGVIDFNKYKKGFAWYNQEKPENLTSYKFPHHDIKEGKLCVHRRGVYTAMAFLFKPNVTEKYSLEDRKGIYEHLAMHYKNDLGKEPPAFDARKAQEDKYGYLYDFDLDKAIKAYKTGKIDKDEFEGFLEAFLTNEEGELEIDKVVELIDRLEQLKTATTTTVKTEANEIAKEGTTTKAKDEYEEFLEQLLNELENG